MDVIEEVDQLNGKFFADHFDRDVYFLEHDLVVLLLFVVGLDALPRKPTSQDVENHVSNAFQIISPGLFDSQMGIN